MLEAEGTFLKPPPSSLNCPIISFRTTDRDVAELVATAFGVGVTSNRKGVHRTEYAATLKGANAVRLMRELHTMLGERRGKAITAALGLYRPPARKLSHAEAGRIRDRHKQGVAIAQLARELGVTRQTIYAIVNERIYRAPPPAPWRDDLPSLIPAPTDCSLASPAELSWLAGWVEGEGSFLAPPPSDPRRPRVSAMTRDLDVIERAARILDVSPTRHYDRRSRARAWSPLFRVLSCGRRAVELMHAIDPMMGARRRAQIGQALAAVS
ncbi:MAG TPA: helix-turn-helix domain-containing protein [Thermoleophilaceae bacterium]|nr:helix-turn-helix domain-containing protein [Thermoleophilaceae bacterium]